MKLTKESISLVHVYENVTERIDLSTIELSLRVHDNAAERYSKTIKRKVNSILRKNFNSRLALITFRIFSGNRLTTVML